jgi:hypothetical protein
MPTMLGSLRDPQATRSLPCLYSGDDESINPAFGSPEGVTVNSQGREPLG